MKSLRQKNLIAESRRQHLTSHESVLSARPPTRERTLAALAEIARDYAREEEHETGATFDFGRKALFLVKRLRGTHNADEHNAVLAALISLADDHDAVLERLQKEGAL